MDDKHDLVGVGLLIMVESLGIIFFFIFYLTSHV